VNQDAALHVARLAPGQSVRHTLAQGRHAWVQVARGTVALNEHPLAAGDGAALSGESKLDLHAASGAKVLVFD
jgi:hypothetical protein